MDLAVSTSGHLPLLAVTVDGRWHAVNPMTGSLVWSMDPMESEPLLHTTNSNPDIVYLLEPVGDGALFAYLPGEAVHRLPLTIRRLVEQSPGRLADGTIHVGSVHTAYYAVDIRSGQVMAKFSSLNDSTIGSLMDEDECVMIGKTDYRVSVFNKDINTFSAKLSVFSGGKGSDDSDFEYFSSNNGIVYKRSSKSGNVNWIHKFMHPVLYLFQTVNIDGRIEAQSIPLSSRDNIDIVQVGMLPEVGTTSSSADTLYILSSKLFPKYKPLRRRQVAQSELAIAHSDDHLKFDAGLCVPGSPIFPDCLVGQRTVLKPYYIPQLEGSVYSNRASDSLWQYHTTYIILMSTTIILLYYYFKYKFYKKRDRKMVVFEDQVVGHGSQGTVVLKGLYEGRQIAVKRILADYFDVVGREVDLLQHSDSHPNVIRYYCMEHINPFVFIGLELCPATLSDLVERSLSEPIQPLLPFLKSGKDVMAQITQGLHHLHTLGIVHRDLKPGNILISAPNPTPRVLISDFGLSRRLDPGQSHFQPTLYSGTVGWRAPECIMSEASRDLSSTDILIHRMTVKVDIFALGCIYHYILTGGGHPFGDNPHEREANISEHCHYCLDSIADPEARDIVQRMLSFEPTDRPSTSQVLSHPYFWPPEKRLAFLADLSDRLERSDRRHHIPQALESNRSSVFPQSGWHRLVDKALFDDLGKYRKYYQYSIQDLLRAIRNKRHHFQELPEEAKRIVGQTPGEYWRYFHTRFPSLLICAYKTVENSEWEKENPFKDAYLSSSPS